MSNSTHLGEKLAEVTPGRTFFQILLLVGLLLSVCGLSNYVGNIQSEVGQADAVVGIVVALLGVLIALAGVRRLRPHRRTALTAYEHGVVELRRGRPFTMRWDEVTDLYRNEVSIELKKTRGFGHQNRILTTWRLRNGRQQELTLESYAQIGHIAEEKVWPRLWEERLAQIEAGETAVFGPIRISRQHIGSDEGSFRWEEIESVNFERTVKFDLVNGRNKNWKETRTLTIPNLPLLKQFVEQLLGEKSGI